MATLQETKAAPAEPLKFEKLQEGRAETRRWPAFKDRDRDSPSPRSYLRFVCCVCGGISVAYFFCGAIILEISHFPTDHRRAA